MRLTCTIGRPSVHYDIDIQSGVLGDVQTFVGYGDRFVIISDDQVGPLYAKPLRDHLHAMGFKTWLLTFPVGEHNKTRETKARLEDQMFQQGLGRDTCIIALGGGVVTDIAGYVASTYCRGIPLIMAPTSLLAMVDASIGGKVGVDVPHGKNLIGSIYQPKKVIADPVALSTLPLAELRNGFVEMIKHGAISDDHHFDYLWRMADQLLDRNIDVLQRAIFDSCSIKKYIVEQDETENGIRRVLNFGHTVGHALELLSNFRLSHGEAVAIGMLIEGHMAVRLGYFSQDGLQKLHELLAKYGLPLKMPPGLTAANIREAMILDKKSTKGQPRFVMLEKIGQATAFDGEYCLGVESAVIEESVKWFEAGAAF